MFAGNDFPEKLNLKTTKSQREEKNGACSPDLGNGATLGVLR